MKDWLMYGVNGWTSYYQRGTASVYIVFALLYLGYLLLFRKKEEEISVVKVFSRVVCVLFLLLLCPGTCQFLRKLNPTIDDGYLYYLLPTAVILGVTGVELFGLVETGDHGRFGKPGYFLGVATLFLTTLSSPFIISTGHLSLARNLDKVPTEVVELADLIGDEDVALLPKRYAVAMGEYSTDVHFYSMYKEFVDETDPTAIVEKGQEKSVNYIVVEKAKLDAENLSVLNETFEEAGYSLVSDEKNYAVFQQGATSTEDN